MKNVSLPNLEKKTHTQTPARAHKDVLQDKETHIPQGCSFFPEARVQPMNDAGRRLLIVPPFVYPPPPPVNKHTHKQTHTGAGHIKCGCFNFFDSKKSTIYLLPV